MKAQYYKCSKTFIKSKRAPDLVMSYCVSCTNSSLAESLLETANASQITSHTTPSVCELLFFLGNQQDSYEVAMILYYLVLWTHKESLPLDFQA